eukprot:gene9572-9734_t
MPDRMEVEAAAMQLLHHCCPQHIPELICYDAANSVLVLPGLADQLAELLSAYLAGSSLRHLQPADAVEAVKARFANKDIVSANEQVVLIGPFDSANPSNRWSSPQLDQEVALMWADAEVTSAAAALLELYRTCPEALIHNDLHAGGFQRVRISEVAEAVTGCGAWLLGIVKAVKKCAALSK